MDGKALYRKGDTVIVVNELKIIAKDGSDEVLARIGEGSVVRIWLIESSSEIEWNATVFHDDWKHFMFKAGIDDIKPTGETLEVLSKRQIVKDVVTQMIQEERQCRFHQDLVPCSICSNLTERFSNKTINIDGDEIDTVRFGSVCEACYDNLRYRVDDILETVES